MHPVIFAIGPFQLHSYGLMMFVAFAAGLILASVRAKRAGISPQVVMDLTVWLMIGGLAGARLAYVLFHVDEFQGRWWDTISPIQSDGTIGIAGLVVLGGVIAAIPTMWWFLRRRNIPFLKMADIMMPSLALGIAIGRIGCLLNGCCFGQPTDLPWGIVFPHICYAGSVYPGLSIHPTQLYSVGYSAIIAVVLLLRTSHRRFEGELFYLFFVLYGIARFGVETVRYYRPGMILFHIDSFAVTVSMVVSLSMITAK
ncbi:MAG: prolipoprotein diacylglyceryl transferase [Candidatus Electryoneaceae bacterium]|nr:prolipoprotein diacylglyceryl transferase [Candidatus Electryoneaceae bacterium]